MGRHGNDIIQIQLDADGSPLNIAGVTDQGETYGNQMVFPNRGDVYEQNHTTSLHQPEINWSTTSVDAILNKVPVNGLCLNEATNVGFAAYQQQHDPCGPVSRSTGFAHRRAAIARGLIQIESLNCPRNGNAVISGRTMATVAVDDAGPPILTTTNNALETSSLQENQYNLYRVQMAGTLLTRVISVTFSWRTQREKIQEAGQLYPNEIDVQRIPIGMTITVEEIDSIGAPFAVLGTALTHANSFVILRKRATTGFVADATAEHIRLTVEGIAQLQTPYRASGTGTGTQVIECALAYDGTNAPIVSDVAYAIP